MSHLFPSLPPYSTTSYTRPSAVALEDDTEISDTGQKIEREEGMCQIAC